MVISDYITPVMYSDITGYAPEWLSDIGRFVGGTALALFCLAITVVTLPLLLIPGAASVPLFSYNMMLYGAALMASLIDKDVKKDMKNINWNPINSNEAAVLKSKNYSFYKGVFVLRYGSTASTGFSFGIIEVGRGVSSTSLLKHEYGHHKQQRLLGLGIYTLIIAIPSLRSIVRNPANHSTKWYEQWATKWGNKGFVWW